MEVRYDSSKMGDLDCEERSNLLERDLGRFGQDLAASKAKVESLSSQLYSQLHSQYITKHDPCAEGSKDITCDKVNSESKFVHWNSPTRAVAMAKRLSESLARLEKLPSTATGVSLSQTRSSNKISVRSFIDFGCSYGTATYAKLEALNKWSTDG